MSKFCRFLGKAVLIWKMYRYPSYYPYPQRILEEVNRMLRDEIRPEASPWQTTDHYNIVDGNWIVSKRIIIYRNILEWSKKKYLGLEKIFVAILRKRTVTEYESTKTHCGVPDRWKRERVDYELIIYTFLGKMDFPIGKEVEIDSLRFKRKGDKLFIKNRGGIIIASGRFP